MNHITQEQAMALVGKVKTSKYTSRHYPEKPAYTLYADALNDLCNAAIEWYLTTAQAAPKRPVNCGTSYCSCIECVMEPNAKLVEACELVDDLIEHQFTGTSAGMNDLQYACDAVHAALDLYKKDQKMNTSAEPVYETAKSMQMPESVIHSRKREKL